LDNPDDLARLFYLAILGLGILAFFLYGQRHRLGRSLQQLAIWAMVFIMVIIAYGFRDTLTTELFPARSVQVSENVVQLNRWRDGHFHADLRVNGELVRFMVDTGATEIVLSREDAEAAGLDTARLNYVGQAQSANGLVRTASVRLDSLAFGDLVDRGVPAAVSAGDMGVSLLGMAYLDRFERIEIQGDRMLLYR
jgi:aspartyl protease family protein